MQNKFIEIKKCERLWAIGSIHGNLTSIQNIHKHIFEKFSLGDKIIYLGNVIGVGERSRETINEIIEFRSKLMAKFKLAPENFIFLRGAQEEMLSKLLELQISPNPKEVLLWIFEHGVDKTLFSYKINYKEILKKLAKQNNYHNISRKILKGKIKPNEGEKEDLAHPSIHPTGEIPRKKLNSQESRIYDLSLIHI